MSRIAEDHDADVGLMDLSSLTQYYAPNCMDRWSKLRLKNRCGTMSRDHADLDSRLPRNGDGRLFLAPLRPKRQRRRILNVVLLK